MKVVVAPDKFAGTLSAAEAAAAAAEGWRRERPGDEVVALPLADGGEGTLAVVAAAAVGAVEHTVEVVDARGVATSARWLALPDGRALVEAAQAIGLHRLPAESRDPLQTTSYGAGQLIAAAVASGAREVVVGLGGTATNDGGVGALIALGFRLLRADGNGVRVGGRWVAAVDRVLPGSAPSVPVTLATDVGHPLLGPRGATAVFGPQKGAGAEALAELEAGLARLADVVERDLPGGPWRDRPGAGAAGGLGFALMAFLGAQVRSGAELVGELVGLDAAVAGVDLVLTGEGSLDAQSAAGKVVAHVAARARAAGARVAAIAGRVTPEGAALVDDAEPLGPEGPARAHEEVAAAAARLARRQPRDAVPPAVRRVQAATEALGLPLTWTRFPEGTRTAADAAAAIGCDVGAIVKSIVLWSDDGAIVVLTSGRNRVDYDLVAGALGRGGVRRATAEEARAATGFAIGGTPPLGHAQPLPLLCDPDLLDHPEVWAAAGTPDTVFPIAPRRLVEATGALVVPVAAAS